MADRIMPVYADAHALPFADGRLCIVVPGLVSEFPEAPPEVLRPYWEWEFCTFHSADWWRRHWSKSGCVKVEIADNLANGWRLWAEWNEWCAEAGAGLGDGSVAAREAEMLRTDGGRTLAFTRVIARRLMKSASRKSSVYLHCKYRMIL